MKRVIKAAHIDLSSYDFEPGERSRLLNFIDKFNDSEIHESVYEAVWLCELFSTVADKAGLEYGTDYAFPPFRENCIFKLSDRKLDVSDIDEDFEALASGRIDDRERAAANPNTPPHLLEKLAKDRSEYVRYKVATNPNTPYNILEKLANDRSYFVSNAATKEVDRHEKSN